jgi:hypothetical protein
MTNDPTIDRQDLKDALTEIMRRLDIDASASWKQFMRMSLADLRREYRALQSIEAKAKQRAEVQALVKKLWDNTTLK